MGLHIERYLPFLLAILVTWGTDHHLGRLSQADSEKVVGAFISAGLSATTTLLGFLLATYSIFQAVNTRRKQFLIQLGHLARLNQYMRTAIWLLLFAVLVLLGLVLVPKSSVMSATWRVMQIATLGVTFLSLSYTVRFVYIFLRLVVDDSENS